MHHGLVSVSVSVCLNIAISVSVNRPTSTENIKYARTRFHHGKSGEAHYPAFLPHYTIGLLNIVNKPDSHKIHRPTIEHMISSHRHHRRHHHHYYHHCNYHHLLFNHHHHHRARSIFLPHTCSAE